MSAKNTIIKDEIVNTGYMDALAPLKQQIARQLDKGIEASKDPVNAGLAERALRTTTIYSPWYSDTCPACNFKFRKEDRVRLCPDCHTAYHDDDQYQLHCWQDHFAQGEVCRKARKDPITRLHQSGCGFRWDGRLPDTDKTTAHQRGSLGRLQALSRSFIHGVERHYTPFGGADVNIAIKGSSMVGKTCPWCDFLIRPGDRVVPCPCGECGAWFHDDIHRHLTCWDAWNDHKGHDFCGDTGRKIERPSNRGIEP